MKIGVRIGLSFCIILVFFIAVSLFSLSIFSQSKQSFFDYSKVSSEAVAILEVDRKVSELQRVILAYSHTGHSGVISRAKKSYDDLIHDLSSIQSRIGDEGNLNILGSMIKTLKGFGENIDALAETRGKRDHLVNERMASLATDRSTLVGELQNIVEIREDITVSHKIHLINEQMLIAQVNATYFLGNRRHANKQQAINALAVAKRHVDELYRYEEESGNIIPRQLIRSLADNISSYENVFFQAVLATRNYLFLVNVVMAGETNEFATLSHRLKTSTVSLLDSFTESTKDRLNKARATTTFVTFGAIVIGFLLALFISRSISHPIGRIADTFSDLVAGKSDAGIPGLERRDEIGQLAKAANVFKDMNEQTQIILKESQALSRELHLRESELKVRTVSLQKSNDELDDFAYVASHDLKSPLRAIDNLCKWVIEDCSEVLPDDSKEHLNKMQQRVKRMENLLSDLLKYSRVGRVDVAVESISVENLVRGVVELINKPKGFIVVISENLPSITTQVSPLQQVFLNLLTNAIKYNDKDTGLVNITSQALSDDLVEFSVSDNGPGIDPKFHERIFQMFQTLNPRDIIESSGMGLAIIKKVVEGQGGQITVTSALGEGSVFTFTWPSNMIINHEIIE
ncbi:ATP-binding protein [bacterium]|nr:ATP-binding protein [bacterium]